MPKKQKKNPYRMGSVKWHLFEIEKIRNTYSKKAREQHARAREKRKKDYHHNLPVHTKDPNPRFRSRIEYDFLKYIRVVFKWALENNPDLTRPQLELLLYLYGTGAFSKKQFNDYHKLMGMYSMKTLDWFIEKGFVKMWRARKGREHALYTLTHQAKIMCNKMHRYACGVEEIPENPVSNKLALKEAPRISGYYMDIIKRMNKDKAPTK